MTNPRGLGGPGQTFGIISDISVNEIFQDFRGSRFFRGDFLMVKRPFVK